MFCGRCSPFSRLVLALAASVVLAGPALCAAAGQAPADKLETVVVVSDRAPVEGDGRIVATVGKGRMFGAARRGDDRVEVQVCEGTKLLHGCVNVRYVGFLADDEFDLGAEALRLAKSLKPGLDVPGYKRRLEALVERLADAGRRGDTAQESVRLIGAQLLALEGFSYAEGVSGLDEMLDQKKGNCLGLCLLYLCAARELKLPLRLVLEPEHAFLRYDGKGEGFEFEATTRRVRTQSLLARLLAPLARRPGPGILRCSLPSPRAYGVLLATNARAHHRAGDHAVAGEKFASAIEINPNDAGAYVGWGNSLLRVGKHKEALGLFARASELDPHDAHNAGTYAAWGYALLCMDEEQEAADKLARAVELDPRNAHAYATWGAALSRLGRHHEACGKFADAVRLNHRHAYSYAGWGRELIELGRHEEAIPKLAEAARLDPDRASTYALWGKALLRAGEHKDAEEKLAVAARLDPRDAYIQATWGRALFRLRRHADACKRLAKAVDLDPRDTAPYVTWGYSLYFLGKNQEACQKLAKATQLGYQDADLYAMWGGILLKERLYAAACDKLAEAAKLGPRRALTYRVWGYALACLGRDKEATEKLDRAAELDPTLKPWVEKMKEWMKHKDLHKRIRELEKELELKQQPIRPDPAFDNLGALPPR